MKSLKESLFDSDLVQNDIMYHPKTKDELKNIIKDQLKLQGPDANLNIIDVSEITDMYCLFNLSELEVGNIDISGWDVSKVKDMSSMFFGCISFNSDLSKWNVSKVVDMGFMFSGCEKFNSDLSKWDVSNVTNMNWMFDGCKKFNSDLNKWNVSNVDDMNKMFDGCKSLKKIPSWYHD